ncbi:ImmA/IrrE family metallo-endopeptidase [Periweissella ghanensis]|uniref:IrrE N-terminal-like domain-containing protein n=1 Tax=Periweissella ghanensis TaxID=467997 RepID=A0ABM8ZDC1_9LACO|nr:ImmA/IrrE family metallo-endopeptidase [Periweissella ghanensis]MCM0600328.1 ImmA/IrrE family metallo-endopeptidase [Periweissella ghanensis]CAH0419240.1 hypothetical protein WGH24286_01687 [Periweissella ghanensis]
MDYIYELLNYALAHGIGVQLDNEHLAPDEPSWCSTEARFIMVNMNAANQREIPFQFSHELAHIINGDTSESHLAFQSRVYSKTEYAAHATAIKLLMSLYAKKDHELNYVTFMDAFAIPDRMEDVVKEEIENYYFF